MEEKVEKYYSVGEFANIIGVTPATLRNWDRKGTFKPHHRTEGGQRLYSESQKKRFVDELVNCQPKTEGKIARFTLLEEQFCFADDLQDLTDAEISLILQELQKEQKRRTYVNITK